jgi:hypothetical protein
VLSDWDWLIAKLLKKVGLWCNRWLSLGGRYILVKVVLEAQPVFWMSLEALPLSVLSRIRKVMFHFCGVVTLIPSTITFAGGKLYPDRKSWGAGVFEISKFSIKL